MKQDIKNRYTDEVIFTAEIDCEENAPPSVRLGLAVCNALGKGANLRWADLRDADLRWADLRDANLQYANLQYANLRDANLRDANLRWADLRDANLRWADLQYANLRDANLRWADLRDANLQGVDLRFYKSDRYDCYIQTFFLQIGCEKHTWNNWLSFSDKRIIGMGGKDALEWWKVNRPILELIRESIKVVK